MDINNKSCQLFHGYETEELKMFTGDIQLVFYLTKVAAHIVEVSNFVILNRGVLRVVRVRV